MVISAGFMRVFVAVDSHGEVMDSLQLPFSEESYKRSCRKKSTPIDPTIKAFIDRNESKGYRISSGIADSVAGFITAYPEVRRPAVLTNGLMEVANKE